MTAPDRTAELDASLAGRLGALGAESWASVALSVILAVAAAFAFVGLATSSYWIDELFSLFVASHHGGPREVLARALNDVHPPAYYLLLNLWIQLFGDSESAVRSLSALLAAASLPAFFLGLRGVFSTPARLLALATAATSRAFFEQAQNGRSYALSFLLGAVIIGLAARLDRRANSGAGGVLWALLWLACLLASFTHFYLFLASGGVFLFLLMRARTRGQGLAALLGGLAIAGLVSAYLVVLLQRTSLDVGQTWFSNDPGAMAQQAWWALKGVFSGLSPAVLAVLGAAALRRRLAGAADASPPGERAAAVPQLASTVVLVTLLGGVAVSLLVAPSFGERNLLVLAPFLWVLPAVLYDAAALQPARWGGRAMIAALVLATAANLSTLRGRFVPRQEEWRASARDVDATPGCAGQPLAVVLPPRFGPPTPFFRRLAVQSFFGRYERQPARLAAFTPAEFAQARNSGLGARLRGSLARGCPILAWGVHDLTPADAERLRRALAQAVGLAEHDVQAQAFQHYQIPLLGPPKPLDGAYVFRLRPSPAAGRTAPRLS